MYDIFFDLNNMHQTVDSSEEDDIFWESYDSWDFVGVDEGPFIKKEYPNGCVCISCKDSFPFAEPNRPDETFICYSCSIK